MSNLRASASISNDIQFTLIQSIPNTQTENSSLGYSEALTHGTGSLNINYGVYSSGFVQPGDKQVFDLYSFTKDTFNGQTSVRFSKLKSIVVSNNQTGYGYDLNIHATGSNALTGIFNGGSGNNIIKPYGVYQYSDLISGMNISATHRYLTIRDVFGSGINYEVVVVGITG